MRQCSRWCWRLVAAWAAMACAIGVAQAGAPSAAERARQILAATGVHGGLVVHVGCGDGTLTAALRANDSYLVHGLDANPKNVAAARAHIQARGLYGKVSVDAWDGERLPYIDNLVNLVVASEAARVTRAEILRVLAPDGVAYVQEGGTWRRTVKPRPANIDEWTHYLRDATNNAVARDTVIGPPRRTQWVGAPRWLRHHDHLSGLSAMVSARNRLFCIIDLGPRWSVQMPPRWTLMARDAFNGVILWQRPIRKWHAHLWPLKKGPAQLMRRLVADGDTVYVTLGVGEPVTALDAATGTTLRTCKGTEGTQEILHADGVLYLLADPQLDAYKALPRESVGALRSAGAKWKWDERERRLMAVDAASGRILWQKAQRVAPGALAIRAQRLYLHDGDKVLCLDARTGRQVWASKPIARWKPMYVLFSPTLVVHHDVVLFAGGEKMHVHRGGKDTMTALSARTGKVLWTAPHPPSGYASAEDLFVIDGLVWCGDTTSPGSPGTFTGRDLHTGEVRRQFPADDWRHMPHHRCYRAKATSNYILTSRTGIEFVDLKTKHWTAHHWVRGSCNYGILPANGLVYAPPHSCACYLLAKLDSFNALAPEGAGGKWQVASDEERSEQGPAFSSIRHPKSPIGNSRGWPTYRGNAARTGATAAAVPTGLKLQWHTAVGGTLTSPVVAGGTVFVADRDAHVLHALDAASGKPRWRYVAGGRIDSPPTVWQGRVLFGCADGSVTCLRATDGALAWRFRAAPADQRLVAYGQVESVWPVHGSVLVHNGVVYCVAGRAMWLDGGLRMLRLDAATGRKLSETVLDDKLPGSQDNLQKNLQWPNLPTALPDVLSCDGRRVYMRAQPFTLDGKRTEVLTTRHYDQQRGADAHLFSPTGFLDDAWWHRSYWLYGCSFIGGAGGWYLAAYQAPAGRILAVDDTSVYGFGRAPRRFTGTPNAYHLFACAKEPKIINRNPNRPPRRRGARIYGKVFPTRLDYRWSSTLPMLVRALAATGEALFVAGPPAVVDEAKVYAHYSDAEVQKLMAEHVAAFAGRKGTVVMAVSKVDGRKLAAYRLASAPVFDGMAAADGKLFLSGVDGKVVCLGAGGGTALEAAADVELGPPPTRVQLGYFATKKHPDFQHLKDMEVMKADLGYRLRTGPGLVGLALRKLDKPLTQRAEFRVTVRPTPDAKSPDTPGNGFIAFGESPDDAKLVKCGFRIAGKRLYICQGPLLKAKAKGVALRVKANVATELRATVDLAARKVTVSMLGKTVTAPLTMPMRAVRWVGYSVHSVTSDFAPLAITGE